MKEQKGKSEHDKGNMKENDPAGERNKKEK
jgi:hypothetical protein